MKRTKSQGGIRRRENYDPVLVALLLLLPASEARAGLFDDAVSGKLEAEPQAETVDGATDDSATADGATDKQQASGGAGTVSGETTGGGTDPVAAPAVYDDAPAPAQPSLLSQTAVELNGYVRGVVYAGKQPEKKAAEIKNAYAEPSLKLRVRKGSYGDGFAEIRFRYGYEGSKPRTELDLREGYVNVYAGPFDFRLGQQVVVWGRADGFNPTSNLTPMSMRVRSPNEDDQRIGNLALRSFFNLYPFRLEGVWVPLYRPTEIPELPFPDFITLRDEYPAPRLDKGLGAGRLHLELPEVELSVSYLFGHAPMPGVVVDQVTFPDDAPSVALLRIPYQHHVVGADFAAPVSDLFGLRGEAAYRHPLHYDTRDQVPEPDLQLVLGVDREFGDLMIIAQYVGRYTFEWEEIQAEPMSLSGADQIPDIIPAPIQPLFLEEMGNRLAKTNQMIQSQTERWQHSAFLRLQWKLLHETLSLEVSGMYNVSTDDWMARPKLAYDITDALQVVAGGEIYGGPDDTLFGMIEEIQSAGYAQLMASF